MSAGLEQTPTLNNGLNESAPLGADFCLSGKAFKDFILDGTSGNSKSLNFSVVHKIQSHLKDLTDHEPDFFDHTEMLGEYAGWYRSALKNNPSNLTSGERSTYLISRLFLSNVESLTALRAFIIHRSWSPKKGRGDNRAKLEYLEKRKVYQEDMDKFYDHSRGDFPVAEQDETVFDTANSARLLVARRDWVSAITTTMNHEFVGSVLSERAVKETFRDRGFPSVRYGTPQEDVSPTKADVVVPIGQAALHLQVKMKMQPAEFAVLPDRTPMGVVVPMVVLRSALSRPEKRQLIRAATIKIEQLAA